jgi:hypothetical protein
VSLDSRLRKLEATTRPEVLDAEFMEWAQSLDIDELRCVALCNPDSRVSMPRGLNLEEAQARGRAIVECAPAAIRLLLTSS